MALGRVLNELRITAAVMPVQLDATWRHGTVVSPTEDLHVALLAQAIHDLRQPRRDRARQRLSHEARLWVMSDDAKWPFSFVNVCTSLGLEAEAVRQRLIRDVEDSARTAGEATSPASAP